MIFKLLKKLITSQEGLALPAVLGLLVFGGLLIVPGVNLVSTSLNDINVADNQTKGFYAADAGIEDVLWSLKHGSPPNATLSGEVNGMQVTMNTLNRGECTLVAGEWVTTSGPHSIELSIDTTMVWDSSANAYKYTITLTWSGPGNCKLTEVGAKLPLGYNYQAGSAALFGGNLSTSPPTDDPYCDGSRLLKWSLPQISIATRTQIFYATGSGALDGEYGWARATRDDVDFVSEISGTLYAVTATAIKNGTVYGQTQVDVLLAANVPYIALYRNIE